MTIGSSKILLMLSICCLLLRVAAFSQPPTAWVQNVQPSRSLSFLNSKMDESTLDEKGMEEIASSIKNESQEEEEDPIPPLPTLDASVILPYLLFVSFWPALAFLRFQLDSLPMPLLDYFDIDRFMALQGMMQEPMMMNDDIVELPALSPAEQMVGAIFGPPSR